MSQTWLLTFCLTVLGTSQEIAEPARLPVEHVDFVPNDYDLPCGTREVEIWESIRADVKEHMPRYSGRLSFVNTQGDVPFLDSVREQAKELQLPGEVFDPEVRLPWRQGQEWTTCHSGLLVVRLLFVATQQMGRPAEVPDMATTLVTSAIEAPWIQILQSGWPVFKLLALLSRWASPFLDGFGADLTTHGRSAQRRAITLHSQCDAGEVGATKQARELIGSLWRHLDADVWRGNATVQSALAEEALAGLHEKHVSVATIPGQNCYWTQYAGDRSTEAADSSLFAASSEVLEYCSNLPDCIGATVGGDPKLLDELPLAELTSPSFLLWCSPLVSGGERTLPCPLARAAGLLTTAYRRFSSLASPELKPSLKFPLKAIYLYD